MEVDDQKPTGVPDGWEVIPSGKAAAEPSKGHDFKILGVNIHVPAEEKPRLDSNVAGWGENGAGVAPEDLLMAGQAGRSIAASAAKGGVVAGVKEAVANASPILKYEGVRTALTSIGVPNGLASAAAMVVAGYKGKPAAEDVPTGAHLDRSVSVRPSELTQEQIAQRVRFGQGTPSAKVEKAPIASRVAPAAPTAAAATEVPEVTAMREALEPAAAPETAPPAKADNGWPDQKALNEARLAERRAEYQARLASGEASTGLTPADLTEYTKQIRAGKSAKEAMESVVLMREFNSKFNLITPEGNDLRFPKGMRGASGGGHQ